MPARRTHEEHARPGDPRPLSDLAVGAAAYLAIFWFFLAVAALAAVSRDPWDLELLGGVGVVGAGIVWVTWQLRR
jgi:hypothetical protein